MADTKSYPTCVWWDKGERVGWVVVRWKHHYVNVLLLVKETEKIHPQFIFA